MPNDQNFTQWEQHRNKALEADIKIPEVLILANSVIIIFLSVSDIRNWLFLINAFMFFVSIMLSLISLWRIRNFHDFMTGVTGETWRVLDKAEKQRLTLTELDSQMNTQLKIHSDKIIPFRRRTNYFQGASLILFIVGLSLILLTFR